MEFRTELGADYRFISDPDLHLIKLYGVKAPLLKLSKRVTFVVGTDGRIKHIGSGLKALNPQRAYDACLI